MKLLQKTHMKRIAWISILMLILPFVLHAQMHLKEQGSVKIYFRQGSANIDPNYMGNGETLTRLASLLDPYLLDSTKVQGRVHIMASASPEGATNTNDRLVEARAKAIADYVGKRFKVTIGHEVEQMGIDWQTLIALMEESADMPAKAEVLSILRNTPETDVYGRQKQLEALQNGVPYRWIAARLYPKLRYAAVSTEIWYASEIRITTPGPMYYEAIGGNGTIDFEKNVDDKVIPTVQCDADWIQGIVPTGKNIAYQVVPNPSTEPRSAVIRIECYGKTYEVTVHQKGAEPAPVVKPEPVIEEPVMEPVVAEPACKNNLFMSISNNGLYDLLLIPNIGAEIYLGKDWSLDANWHYSWWKTDKRHRYWRTYGGDLTIRKWFGKKAMLKPLTGHHVGLYGQMITYDFEFGGKGYLADRWSWAVGAEYGYSLPIARRLNLDFSIGIGYHWGKYDEYLPIDDHYVWQATKNRKFFGPTKAEVSLVWLIGCDNYNKEKGGKR